MSRARIGSATVVMTLAQAIASKNRQPPSLPQYFRLMPRCAQPPHQVRTATFGIRRSSSVSTSMTVSDNRALGSRIELRAEEGTPGSGDAMDPMPDPGGRDPVGVSSELHSEERFPDHSERFFSDPLRQPGDGGDAVERAPAPSIAARHHCEPTTYALAERDRREAQEIEGAGEAIHPPLRSPALRADPVRPAHTLWAHSDVEPLSTALALARRRHRHAPG